MYINSMSDTDIPVRAVRQKSEQFPPPSSDPAYVAEVEKKLLLFVDEQISKMRDAIHLSAGHEPTFFEVNEALCSYQDTNLGLLALYNTAKIENVKAKEAFDDWFAGRYIEIRDRVNPRSLAAQKWYSQKEVEMIVRHEYADEYTKHNWDVVITEQQLAFLRRMLESWASYQYVLTQLSKNLVAEMNGLGVEDALSRAADHNNQ